MSLVRVGVSVVYIGNVTVLCFLCKALLKKRERLAGNMLTNDESKLEKIEPCK